MTYKQCEKTAKRAAKAVKDKSLWLIAYCVVLQHLLDKQDAAT